MALCNDSELTELVVLVNAAYRGAGGWTSEVGLVEGERLTLAALRRDMAATPSMRIYLLRGQTELLACVRVEDECSPRGEAACHISMLAVRPERQDARLGRRMLQFAENEARERGARVARMSVVSVRSSLIAWYERRGYRPSGETEPFPYEDARFGQPQQRGLKFIVLQKRLAE